MRVASALFGLMAIGCFVFACGSSTDSTAQGGGDAGDAGGGNSEDSGGGSEEDSPYTTVDCPLKTTGFKVAKVATNIARGTTPEWEEPNGAMEEDGTYAKVTLDAESESAELRLSDFGFNVPESALTYGIEVEFVRQAPQGGVADGQINVHVEGKASRFKFISGPWPSSIVGTHHYGQAVDTWGMDLYPADVNKPSFGVSVYVKKTPDATGTPVATVDALKVAIHYCEK